MILLSKLTVHSVIYLSVFAVIFSSSIAADGERKNHTQKTHNYDDIISARRLDGYVTTLEPALVTSLPR